MNIWQNLPKPFFVLAPMDDVTDTVFRRVVARCARPDVFFTEFASVDGFCSPGKQSVEKKLRFYKSEQPLIAQIWGVNPENFYKTAKVLAKRGYAGIDLNMGCPVKNVVKSGACSALMNNRNLAREIILATKKGAGEAPISIKTRIGQNEYDESWIRFLLEHKPAALTLHFRSAKEMSKIPARWDLAKPIVKLRNELSLDTVIIGNGDVLSLGQGAKLANTHGVDGIMIARGVFQDPFAFAESSPWGVTTSQQDRVKLYLEHVQLFIDEWGDNKNPAVLKKFAKVYISAFNGAKELREELMAAETAEALLSTLKAETSRY